MDTPIKMEYLFQDGATPIMEGIINLHNKIMCIMVYIGAVVFSIIGININYHNSSVNINPVIVEHNTLLEIIWTLTPAAILIGIAIPSFSLLYAIDEVINPLITSKVTGHQWYWSYELAHNLLNSTNYAGISGLLSSADEFDANLITSNDLLLGDKRLLQADNALILPTDTHIRYIITSSDVIHSWGVPSLGIKLDAVPGRLSQTNSIISRIGNFYGQCSEICGVNHGGMPIEVISV